MQKIKQHEEGEESIIDKISVPELNHLILCATHIEKTARFYHSCLGIAMSEIEQVQHETPITQLAKYALGTLPQPVLGFFKSTITSHLRAVLTQLCYLRTTGDAPLLVIMAEQNYETGVPIPVSGNTVYKTSWLLSPGVNTEILAWDYSESDVWFEWADTGSDGRTYTPELMHSLFLRDPDGRLVELIPNQNEMDETPIVSKFTERVNRLLYPTIYTDNLKAWGAFMSTAFKIKDVNGERFQHDSVTGSEILSWRSSGAQWPLLAVICETAADGRKIPYGGYGLEHIGYAGPKDEFESTDKSANAIISHRPLRPDKSYEHHLFQGPDGVSIEYMTETL